MGEEKSEVAHNNMRLGHKRSVRRQVAPPDLNGSGGVECMFVPYFHSLVLIDTRGRVDRVFKHGEKSWCSA